MELSRLKNRWAIFAHDILWVPVALGVAYWIRFNLGHIPAFALTSLYVMVLAAIPLHAISSWFFGCYRGVWRFASVPDLVRIAKAVFAGALATTLVVFLATRLDSVPRSVLLLYPMLLTLGMAGPRIIYRMWRDHAYSTDVMDCPRAMVIGAGRGGELLIRDLLRHGPYRPVVILDDDPMKLGSELHGVRVRGSVADLEALAVNFDIELILIAIPSATRSDMATIVDHCANSRLPVKILPSLNEGVDLGHSVDSLRSLTVEDLLGREQVCLDDIAIEEFLHDRVVLVTGAGGSIGSELCLQIAQHTPRRLVLLDNSEFNLYTIEQKMEASCPEVNWRTLVGDVRNRESMKALFETFRPDVVIHAAAYKHVPIVDVNSVEGVRNNVFGTKVVADMAVSHDVDKFVLISTDKTVNPTNVMGASKRVAELYCQYLNSRSSVHFMTTRFGNVLGSTGSVVPLFEKQIQKGGPVTVTHPDVTRFFMSIHEAAALILQAGAMGRGGEIFVMDMGEPVRICDLAEKMIRLYGYTPGRDIHIEYVGMRAGEKLHEELFYSGEEMLGTTHPKLLLASAYPVDGGALEEGFSQLEAAVRAADDGRVVGALCQMVPEFRPELAAHRQAAEPPLRVVK